MTKFALVLMLALELAVSGCGTNSPVPNAITTAVSGNWEASLTGGAGPTSELNFVTTFTVKDTTGIPNEPLDITGFGFFNNGACFTNGVDQYSQAGLTTLITNSSGQVSGDMTYTVASATSDTVLTLTTGTNGGVSGTSNGSSTTTGTLSNGIVWGTWTLQTTNTACVPTGAPPPTGNFIMCQGIAVNNPKCAIP
jgi:hypothetical protein